jgi:hypothetical protein
MPPPLVLFAVLVVGALVASEAGYRLGRLAGPRDEAFDKQLGVVRGASFALVAFLIGFAFSGAGARYVDRLDLIVKEANALGTAWLRADVLPEPARGALKDALRQYTADRITLLQAPDMESVLANSTKVPDLQGRMWKAGLEGTQGNPSLMLLVLPALNDVIDLHTEHLSGARRHIPPVILIALLATTVVSLAVASFGNGQARERFTTLNFVYGLLLAIALWMTIDLDNPQYGLIRLSTTPLDDALASMKR